MTITKALADETRVRCLLALRDQELCVCKIVDVLGGILPRGVTDPAVLTAMERIDRGRFVRGLFSERAYEDTPLPIACGQTISQPSVVGLMTQALELTGRDKVLEVGTGSGYQAAILAQCGARVTSIERDPDLARQASERLARLGYDVDVVVGDGSAGYPPHAPYAGIVVGAGAPEVPEPLLAQLDDGGRLVVPIGGSRSQRLTIVQRRGDSRETWTADACVFVPLVGEHGHPA